MSEKFAFDVFLSHDSKDKPRVRKLAAALRERGLRVWLDDWVLKPGDDIYLTIERGLATSRTLILCMSKAAFGSDWIGLERSTVLFRDPANTERRFVPLLLTDCERPDTLRRFKYVDYRRSSNAAFEELLNACLPEPEPATTASSHAPPEKTEEREPIAVFERKLIGHENWVRSVAISPDGKWAASGSDDKTIRVWNIDTGECQATLKGRTNAVQGVGITPDGKRILSASDDETVRVWDARTGKEILRLRGHKHIVTGVAALLDGLRAISCAAGLDPTLKLWDLISGKCLQTYAGHKGPVASVAVDRKGLQVISGSYDQTLKLWDIETGQCLTTLKGHSEQVNSVQITPDGRYAVSGSEDRAVKIWDLEKGICIGTLEGHQDGIDSVAISPDGVLIASTGFTDNTIRLWDFHSGECVQTIHEDARPEFISIAISPDGSRLIAGGTGPNDIYVYRLAKVKAAPPTVETRRYTNAKVVLLGESGVGKSGLAHRLIEDKFIKTYSTHGMQVWRLDLPIEPDETIEREALLWDLAGQDDYRLIHQLFLDETAVALMLVNPQRDDPFAEVGDWLKALRAAVSAKDARRDVAKLLIAARTDVGAMKISRRKIDDFLAEHGFADYLLTSAKRGDNCSDRQNADTASELKQLIARHIPWDQLPWTSTPRLLAEIKNAMVEMTERKDTRLLRFAELSQRLENTLTDETFTESDTRTAVTLLGNQGLVMPLKFGDLVLMRPEMLNGYAGAVIRAARAHQAEIGCVREQDVFDRKIDFEGVDRLAPADEELLMRAMVQTLLDRSLCIAEDTPEGRHLIFPSQYRREKEIPSHPEIFVSYTFTGELQTVYTTLVVRLWYSREFDKKELWRNAAEFQTSKAKTVGLIMQRIDAGEATLSVFFEPGVPDELKVVFIEYVHRHLGKYARDVRRDRRYICANPKCNKPVRDLEAVRERLADGKEFITCNWCDKRVPLIDHIERRLASDPVARRVIGMDERATRELDTQALEQILIGHMMAICGEANQIFRPVTMFDHGIDGEVEFKNNDGTASGKKIYVQLKSGGSYLRTRKADGKEVFDIGDHYLRHWISQPVDVYLVIRDAEETIRWMNVTRYLKSRKDKQSRQIIFKGEKLDAKAVWYLRDAFFPREQRYVVN
jgi:WD40 repeat protein